MLRRISLFAVVGVLAMVVLAACGDDDEGEEPTVTRIPATEVPEAPSPTTEAGAPSEGSPAASPSTGSPATPDSSPVAEETAPALGSPEATTASPEASPSGSAEAPGTPTAVTEVTVELLDIRFDPTEITIPANTDVVVHLTNKGVTVHSFDVDQLNVHSGELAANETMDVTINAAPGRYEYYCAIPGHKQAGMVGTLIVQ